jgi:hypothetical protein
MYVSDIQFRETALVPPVRFCILIEKFGRSELVIVLDIIPKQRPVKTTNREPVVGMLKMDTLKMKGFS